MNWMTKLAFGLLLSLSALAGSAPQSHAADRFGVVGIENTTHVTVRFQHRWGDRSWNEDVLAPGAKKWFAWEFSHAGEDMTPTFHVKFDSDLSPGKFFESYRLQAYQALPQDFFTSVALYLESDRRIALCVECSCVRDMLAALSYVARVRQRVAAGVEVVRQVSPRYPPCRLGTVIF